MPVAAVRTPDERFADLPDFPWEPKYLDWEGLRLARIDEGSGAPPVVLFHGEPTWSFLWRKVMPPLLADGHRCIAPDLPGFGRSDKPTDFDWYTLDRHTEATTFVLEELGVRDATFVIHDWGGAIGQRVAAERPEMCGRMVVMDTGIFNGRGTLPEPWIVFRDFVKRTEDLPVGFLVKGACATDPGDDVVAAYDAPYPDAASKAGTRAFPLMMPASPEDPGAAESQAAAEYLAASDLPSLCLWADSDPVIPLAVGHAVAKRLNFTAPEVIENASHFLQEDQGKLIGERIAAWLRD